MGARASCTSSKARSANSAGKSLANSAGKGLANSAGKGLANSAGKSLANSESEGNITLVIRFIKFHATPGNVYSFSSCVDLPAKLGRT